MKAYKGSRSIALSFFNLGATWGWVVNTTLSRFTLGKEIQYLSYKTLGEPRGQSGWVQRNRPRTDFETRTAQSLARRYTATLPPESGDVAPLIVNLDTGGAWATPHSGRFTPGLEYRCRWNKRLVDPTVCLHVLEERKNLIAAGIRVLRRLALSLITTQTKSSRFRKLVWSLILTFFPTTICPGHLQASKLF